MTSLNKVMLIGRVGKEPEIRSLSSSNKMANFSIATSVSWKDKSTNERKEITDWHNIVVYNANLVPIIESYVNKGSLLYLEGALKTRKWEDKSGSTRYTTEVVLNHGSTLKILESRSSEDYKESLPTFAKKNQKVRDEEPVNLDDEIPF